MKAAVAAGHDLTATAARDLLHAGGNAFDGVMAAMMMSCVCEPVLASPGGGGYLMARDGASGEVLFYDFFVQTPLAKTPLEKLEFYETLADFGAVTQCFHIGAGAAAVPAILPGFFQVANQFCKLDHRALLQPALQAAREGFLVNDFYAYLCSVITPILTAHDDVKKLFFPKGTMPREGEVVHNHGLANLFELMGEQGEDICQNGAYIGAITKQSLTYGGHLRRQDLQGYQVKRSKPLVINFQGFDIYLPPPPAAGGTLIAFGLLLIDKLLQEKKIFTPGLVDLVRVMTQTNRVRNSPDNLLTPAIIESCFAQLEGKNVACKGTTHISVIDEELNIAALTLTNGEGNGRLVGDFGFMLNNMLGEADLHPNGFHNWQEGQRLSSMMSPTLICSPEGQWTALGSGGSNRIRTAILQVIVNLISRKMGLQEAVDLARLHGEQCGTISFEQAAALEFFSARDVADLAKAFPDIHNWQQRNMFFGGVHCVSAKSNDKGRGVEFEAGADKRRSGCALLI